MSEKFPKVTSSQILKVLKKLGFIEDRTKGSHVILLHPESRIRTVVPFHKGKTLPVGTLKGILAEAEISIEKLRELF